jgi:hypothetical protein
MNIKINSNINNIRTQLIKYLEKNPNDYYSRFTYLAKCFGMSPFDGGTLTSIIPGIGTLIEGIGKAGLMDTAITGLGLPSELINQLNFELSKLKSLNDFCRYLDDIIEMKHLKRTNVAINSCLSPSYFYDICNGTQKIVPRDTVIKIALGLQLDFNETSELMKRLGYSLFTSSIKRDKLILFCIDNKICVEAADKLLRSYKVSGLGLKKKKEIYKRFKENEIAIKKNKRSYKSLSITKCL